MNKEIIEKGLSKEYIEHRSRYILESTEYIIDILKYYIHDKYNIYFDLQNLLKQIYEDNRIKIKYINQNNSPITKYDSINNYYVILLNYNSSVALNNFNIALQLGHILLNHKI